MTKFGRGGFEGSLAQNTRRIATAVEYLARVELLKQEGEGKVVSTRKEVASGGTLNLHLKNPDGTGEDANLSRINISTQFEGVFDIYDTFSSAPSGGSTLQIDSLRMDSASDVNGGVMEANQDVSFTADGSTHWVDTIPSGGAGGQMGGETLGSEPRMEENREIVIEVTNQSGSAGFASIGVVYTEEAN